MSEDLSANELLIHYKPFCYFSKPVYLSNNMNELFNNQLIDIQNDWNKYSRDPNDGLFFYSIFPTIYSITASTVVTIFLSIIVFTNFNSKPSFLLKVGTVLASINLTLLLIVSIIFLEKNHEALNSNSGDLFIDFLSSYKPFNIIDFLAILILQFVQVQIIMRIFSRQKEKRFTFFMGGILSIISQVIWAVSTYSSSHVFALLPAFVYLLRISLSVIFSVLIGIYCFMKRKIIFQKKLILITTLTFLTINLEFAFFIADVSNLWVSELSEIFNTCCYVISTVLVWEWINRVHHMEKIKEKSGILGRPFYEEEEINNNNYDDYYDNNN
ncbi:Rim21p ASCRUDRAFT_37629, partial [Ascoidea rubescens DSM 1968]